MSNRTELSRLQRAALIIKDLQGKLQAQEDARREPIAIVGMACRFPGGANTPAAYWQLLANGVDAICDTPASRWNVDAFYDPQPMTPGKMYVTQAGYLHDIDCFDPQFFGISPAEANRLDPQQRLLLEVSWEALEGAGLAPEGLAGSQTGTFIGINQNDYASFSRDASALNALDVYDTTGNGFCFVSGRLAFVLGLQGPNMAIDTACSSSLVAMHQACQSLRNGECQLALAGGVQLMLAPTSTVALSQMNALAPDGRAKAFDAAADGFSRGEGCAIIVLKRLSDAQADQDNILAVIRGSAVNHDGTSSGLTVPNGLAQQALIGQALHNAGVEPAQVDYIEAHGTGTKLGDPIEVDALNHVFRDRPVDNPLLIGTAKSNVGHLEAVAGMAGVMKVVLALQHGEIPPQLHFNQPNPQINWQVAPIQVVTEPTPWPRPRRIAGVSAFGMSGTNVHVVLEAAPAVEHHAPTVEPEPAWNILTLSAKNQAARRELARRYLDLLAQEPETALADLCHTANTGRNHFAHRLAVAAPSTADLQAQLAAFAAEKRTPGTHTGQISSDRNATKIAFLFTGQGAQYVDMGRALYESDAPATAVFRETLRQCDEILHGYLGQSIIEILHPKPDAQGPKPRWPKPSLSDPEPPTLDSGPRTPDSNLIHQTEYTQPALFALEYALAKQWLAWGVRPALLMGHSVGEVVAACVAGVFSLEDGLKLIAARGRLMGALPQDGAMVSILADEERVRAAMAQRHSGTGPAETGPAEIAIAAVNGPESTVISGQREPVLALAEALAADGIKTRALTVSHAFHSPLMDPILAEFRTVAAGITYHKPTMRLVSNVTGALAGEEITTPEYWVRHVCQTVRFADGIATAHAQKIGIYLEIGPKPTLLGMAKLAAPPHLPPATGHLPPATCHLPSLREQDSDHQQILSTLGALYVRGVHVDWSAVAGEARRKVALPTYPFQRQRYWVDSALFSAATGADAQTRAADTQTLLKRPDMADWFYAPVWQQRPALPATRQAAAESAAESAAGGQCWVLFVDSCGVGAQMAEHLRALDHSVVTVEPGVGFAQVETGRYTLDPQQAHDYDALFQALHARGLRPQRLCYLWTVTPVADTVVHGPERDRDHTEIYTRSFTSLLYLAQALGRLAGNAQATGADRASANEADTIELTIVSNQLHNVTGAEVPQAVKAMLLGPARIIPLEYAHIACRSVDVVVPSTAPGSRPWTQLVTQLVAECSRQIGAERSGQETPGEEIIAYRGTHRWVQSVAPVRVEKPGKSDTVHSIRQGGVYLITGGLGGIGLTLAQHLAQWQTRLILVGRTPLPDEDEWQGWLETHGDDDSTSHKIRQIQALRAKGAEVLVRAADVADRAQMAAVLAEAQARFGHLHGVIHAAGVAGGGLIQNRTLEAAEAVLRPKVQGLLNLAELLQEQQLDFWLLCSSVSSLVGSLGQMDYTAANAFLDAFAAQARMAGPEGSHVMAVNWDAWQAVGMAVNTPVPAALQAQRDHDLQQGLTPQEGAEIFDRLLATDLSQVIVSTRDLPMMQQWHQISSGQQRHPMAPGVPADNAPDASPEPIPTANTRPEFDVPYVAPSDDVEAWVASVWQAALGVAPIGIHDHFFDHLGGESLQGMSLINQFQKELGEVVHVTAIFDNPTVARISAYFKAHYSAGISKRLPQWGANGSSPAGSHGHNGTHGPVSTPESERVDRSRLTGLRTAFDKLTVPAFTVAPKNPPAIFVLSPPRSGSTLLRVLMAGNPQLFAPPELNLLLRSSMGELQQSEEQASMVTLMAEGGVRTVMQIRNCEADEAEAVIQAWIGAGGPAEAGNSVAHFYRHIQSEIRPRTLVDKSPAYAFHPSILQRMEAGFEDARFVHLVRHPFGMIRSYEEARMEMVMPVASDLFPRRTMAELIWLLCHENIVSFLATVPTHRQHRLRFEAMVTDPEAEMGRLCQFLGVDLVPEMLQPYGDSQQRMTDGVHADSRMVGDMKFHTHRQIDPAVATRWQEVYTTDFLGDITWQMAETLGYERLAAMPGAVGAGSVHGSEEGDFLTEPEQELYEEGVL